MTSDLADLIARLERAEGPDCELDCAIYAFVFVAQDNPPPYTGSVDAALSLLPRNAFVEMSFGGGRAYAEVNPDMPENTGEGVAAIPALALCIAALRAREDRNAE